DVATTVAAVGRDRVRRTPVAGGRHRRRARRRGLPRAAPRPPGTPGRAGARARRGVVSARDARHRRKLLFPLSSATFFEGYDTFALPFVLSLVLSTWGRASGTPASSGR